MSLQARRVGSQTSSMVSDEPVGMPKIFVRDWRQWLHDSGMLTREDKMWHLGKEKEAPKAFSYQRIESVIVDRKEGEEKRMEQSSIKPPTAMTEGEGVIRRRKRS